MDKQGVVYVFMSFFIYKMMYPKIKFIRYFCQNCKENNLYFNI